MALTNYAGLIAAVQEFTARADLTTSKVDHFIDLAENYFNGNLRTHEMETSNSSFTVSNGVITNPSDLLQWKVLKVSVGGSPRFLQPMPESQVAMLDDGATGAPLYYSVRGGNTVLKPTPDGSYTVSGTYYQRIPALSDSNSSNWISSNYSDAYFFPMMAMAEAFAHNDMRLQTWTPMLEQAVANVVKTSRNKGYGGQPVMTTEYPVY